MCAMLLLAVAFVVNANAVDPDDGPPPLLDEPPAQPQEVEPRPLEPPPAPDTGEPRHDDTAPHVDHGAREPEQSEKNGDIILLGIDYLVIFIPILNTPLFAPIAQGLVHLLLAETLVHNTYPYWWAGILAGYATYALSGTMLVGGYVLLVVGATAGAAANNVPLVLGGLLGGLAVMGLGVVVALLEPLPAYFVGTMGGKPIAKSRSASSFEGHDGVDALDVE